MSTPALPLGDYIRPIGFLARTPYGNLAEYGLAELLAAWKHLHQGALAALRRNGVPRVHPTAFVHPSAIIGDEAIIGPGAHVHEFTTVRGHSVLGAAASVGFNCEVTHASVGDGAVLGHRIGVNHTLVGARAHLSASVVCAAIHLTGDMRAPSREVFLRTERGLYHTGSVRFGALIGDHVQTGAHIVLGPGAAIGRRTRITSGVVLAARTIPADSILTSPGATDTHVRPNRPRLTMPENR
ncbi:transferase [Streptomyces sp. NPDC050504]|uniref:transferase n=1 Tax=Streptomyces sp. NPDC050504 TaxID=3365618 RepID=UPI0037A61914